VTAAGDGWFGGGRRITGPRRDCEVDGVATTSKFAGAFSGVARGAEGRAETNVDSGTCGGNTDDIGDTCGGGAAASSSAPAWCTSMPLMPKLMPRVADACTLCVAGVCVEDVILSMYHDDTQPRSPPSSLTACKKGKMHGQQRAGCGPPASRPTQRHSVRRW
jgi:hypothetical protein